MLPGVTPDLEQNIFITLYLIFSHNQIAIAYFCGLILSIGISWYRPSRPATLLLVGFAILLFQYEYDKHIITGFREQTMQSLITETPHHRFGKLIDILISDFIPIALFVGGWAMVYTAFILSLVKKQPTHQ